MWIDYDTRVVGREMITVPLGTFNAYKIVVKQARQDGARVTLTLWYDPDWSVALRNVYEFRGRSSGAPTAPDIMVRELTARTRGK